MAAKPQRDKKNAVNEEMVDQIVKERQNEKGWKEQLYDKINIPLWLLDLIIVLLCAAFFYILIFKRNGA